MVAQKISLADSLPRLSYLTLLDKYIMKCYLIVFYIIALVSVVRTMQFYETKSKDEPEVVEGGADPD